MAGVAWRVLAIFLVLQLSWVLLRPASVLHATSIRTRATHSLASLWAPRTDTRGLHTSDLQVPQARTPTETETIVAAIGAVSRKATQRKTTHSDSRTTAMGAGAITTTTTANPTATTTTIMTAEAAQAAALERAKAMDRSARDKTVRMEPLLTAARNGGAAGDAASAQSNAGDGASAVTQIGRSFRVPVVPFPGRQANPPPVVGVVFYGRRSRVRILDCYLQRNLVSAGGLLSEVVFVSATWDRGDLDFLDRLLQLRKPYYRKLIPERLDKGYTGHYAWMDPGTLYVKIDDDVVYVADHAIDHMLQAHNLNRYHLISANVINHQPLELPHSQKGAHTLWEQAVKGDRSSWRQVMRPATQTTSGQADSSSNVAAGVAASDTAAADVVPATTTTTTTTPVPTGDVRMEAVPFVDNGWDVWGDWARAANVHYSFLDNARNNRLQVYEFPEPEGNLWDFNAHVGYIRWRINMIMFKGSTIDVHVYNMSSTTGTYPGDDEDYITRILPQQLNRTSAAASKALAVHFSFYPQREGLENSTDLLDRYALLAERTCGSLVPAEVTRKLRF